MASGQIRMTPDTMRGRLESTGRSRECTECNRQDGQITGHTAHRVEGAASEAYANKFAELRPSFVKGKELIDDIAMALDKTAEAVESTDTQIANQFSM